MDGMDGNSIYRVITTATANPSCRAQRYMKAMEDKSTATGKMTVTTFCIPLDGTELLDVTGDGRTTV